VKIDNSLCSVSLPILESDGTLANPSYSFSNESGLGMYRAAAGELGLVAGGILAVQILSSGVFLGVPLSAGSFALTCGSLSASSGTFTGTVSCPSLSITSNPIFLYKSSTAMSVSNSSDTNYTLWDTPIVHSGITTDGTKITVPSSGRYFVNVQIPFNTSSTGYRYVFLYVNSTSPGTNDRPLSCLLPASNNSTVSAMATMTGILNLNANDYFVVGTNQNSGGSLSVGTLNTVFVARISVYFLSG
jgi:hypothetical protein